MWYISNTHTPSIIILFQEVRDTTDYDSSQFQRCSNVEKKKNANNNFQTLLNENYILISAMLKWEEEQNVTNWWHLLHRLILKGQPKTPKYCLWSSQMEWKWGSESW